MNDYIAPDWQPIFAQNGLTDFHAFWERKADWFEAPNNRRGGWSGVARLELTQPDGRAVRVFVKRQENHVTRTWRHPFRGMATLCREFEGFRRFEESGIPTPRLLYFAVRQVGPDLRAILVTEELTGFRSLQDLTREWVQTGWPSLSMRRDVIAAIARTVHQMHAQGWSHNCLRAKHLFLKFNTGTQSPARPPIEVRVIDLEKVKRALRRKRAVQRDLCRLMRDCYAWRATDQLRFMELYLDGHSFKQIKPLCRSLVAASAKRDHRRAQEA